MASTRLNKMVHVAGVLQGAVAHRAWHHPEAKQVYRSSVGSAASLRIILEVHFAEVTASSHYTDLWGNAKGRWPGRLQRGMRQLICDMPLVLPGKCCTACRVTKIAATAVIGLFGKFSCGHVRLTC